MKKVIGVAAILFVLVFSGCKKADDAEVPTYLCKNTCYLCYNKDHPGQPTDTLCNTDYTTEELFQLYLQDDSIVGYICKEIQPTIFHEFSGNDVTAQIDTAQANRLRCYNKQDYHPSYFDYDAFYAAYVERTTRCTQCWDTIAKVYAEIYVDTLNGYYDMSQCTDCATYTFCLDTAMPYAVARVNAMGMHCGIPQSPYYIGVGYILTYLKLRQYDPVSPEFTQQAKDSLVRLLSWLDFNSAAAQGLDGAAIFKACP